MLPEPISPGRREDAVAHMAAGLLGAKRHFRAYRQAGTSGRTSEPRRSIPKLGRNDPCPCGSAKKYKCGCDGELRVLTDAFRAQDFATEAAIHAGKVTGLGAGEADGSRHVTGAPNSSTPGSYCEKQLHPSSLSSHVLSSTWQLRWFLVVDARKRPLAAATLH